MAGSSAIGRWTPSSTPTTAPRIGRGEIHFGWVLEGRAIQDVWILPGFFFGTTLRVYDPGLDAWHILWSDPLKQYYTRQVGRARGKDIVQEGTAERRRRDPLELHGDRAGRLPLARRALARRRRELAIAGRFPRPPRGRLNASLASDRDGYYPPAPLPIRAGAVMGTSKTILLTRADAACLDAIRAGAGRQNLIALQTKLTLKDAAASIAKLAAAGLVIRQQRYCWEATRRGKRAVVTIVANPERSRGGKRFGEIRPGTSSDRLIALLDHPRRGTELAKELGISSQRVHQLVIRLVALGFLRVGDERHPLHIVCRAEDHSVLLRITQERVLSSLSQGGATTVR